jgi:hypothetical protein
MRKKFVVSKKQLSFIIASVGLIVGVSLTLAVMVYFNFQHYLKSLAIAEGVVKQISHDMRLVIIAVASIIFTICFFAILVMSNKIYGPLWRVNQVLKRFADGGQVDSFQIRKGDAIDEIPQIPKIASFYGRRVRRFDNYELLP